MSKFVNPYNFVAQGSVIGKKPTNGHERFNPDRFSGSLQCEIRTLSPLLTQWPKGRFGDMLIIPGTGLKGMIRAVAETIAICCMPTGKKNCSSQDELCICCRLFGWLSGSNVHMGKICIQDASLSSTQREVERRKTLYLKKFALNKPKPEHKNLYLKNGRKFYYHHHCEGPMNTEVKPTKDNKTITSAKRDTLFCFQVDFTDLEKHELGLLFFSIVLEDGLYHKFGMGKPLGFGSLQITLTNIELLPDDYYTNFLATKKNIEDRSVDILTQKEGKKKWGSANAEERRNLFVKECVDLFFKCQFGGTTDKKELQHYQDLKIMLSLNNDDFLVKYPNKEWFGKNRTLPSPQEIDEGKHNWLEE